MAEPRRDGRSFAPLPPGIVRVRLEGESAGELATRLAAIPGVSVVTGPDRSPGGRLYLAVTSEPPVERQPTAEFPATWAGGHALVIEFGDEELTARCQCGHPLGSGTPLTSLETFAQPWETHAMTAGR